MEASLVYIRTNYLIFSLTEIELLCISSMNVAMKMKAKSFPSVR